MLDSHNSHFPWEIYNSSWSVATVAGVTCSICHTKLSAFCEIWPVSRYRLQCENVCTISSFASADPFVNSSMLQLTCTKTQCHLAAITVWVQSAFQHKITPTPWSSKGVRGGCNERSFIWIWWCAADMWKPKTWIYFSGYLSILALFNKYEF